MSFKREGDDNSQLNTLKKRRVADLLSNFIPEDEAARMNNGRYTCLVCAYRPVLDTVDMLTVHRNGKRHLAGLKSFYGKKAQLKNQVTKRQHEAHVQAEGRRQEPSSSAPLLAQTRKLTRHALLSAVPYNSCHRKGSAKHDERGSDSGEISSSKTAPEQENACRKTDVSNRSGGCTAAASDGSRPSGDTEGSRAAVTLEAEPIAAQRRSELEHYLKLKSEGWLRDRSGQWVKDENVEFDSDEEEPPSLAPLPAGHGGD